MIKETCRKCRSIVERLCEDCGLCRECHKFLTHLFKEERYKAHKYFIKKGYMFDIHEIYETNLRDEEKEINEAIVAAYFRFTDFVRE